MRRHRYQSFIALAAVLTLIGTACQKTEEPTDPGSGEVTAGGTFRVEIDEFPWEQGYGFDPTVEYVGDDWAVLKQLLLRGLTSYNFRPDGEGGSTVIPDMAVALGTANEDFTEFAYELKTGIRFGNPINREITAGDIYYAFRRLGTPELTAGGYPNYYVPIVEGMQEFADGDADEISGIEMPDGPDGYKITFTLTTSTPDWDYRLAMPAAAPIPQEAGRCFREYGAYGNYVVSSGPYEIAGMNQVSFDGCNQRRPSGFKLEDHLTLVRNEQYDAATDDTTAREALPDRFEFTKNTNPENSYDKMERGEIEYAWSSIPPDVVADYSTDEEKRSRFFINPDNATWYLTMTMTEPPFDDVNVRKAVNAVMDKAGMITAIGGPSAGLPAEHNVSPSLLGGNLDVGEFNPYNNAEGTGDVDQARGFLQESKYETDAEGNCTDDACKRLVHVTRNTDPFPELGQIVEDSLKKIGFTFRSTVEAASFYGEAGTPASPVQLTSGAGWGPDWPEAFTFFEYTFRGTNISIANNINISMVGFTPEIAESLNEQYQASETAELTDLRIDPPDASLDIPSVDSDIDTCAAIAPGDERTNCWVTLDQKIMNEIVPWVPYRWSNNRDIIGPSVSQYAFDQFAGSIAFAHVAVDQAKQED